MFLPLVEAVEDELGVAPAAATISGAPGSKATDLTGGRGRARADVAGLSVWTVTDCPAEELNGVVGLGDRKRATR